MFPGSEFSARTVLPWNLRAQEPRRAQRLRKDADEQRDTQSGRRAALAAREARGLRVHLSQIVRKVASEARECTSEVARPRVLTPHRLLEGGTATKSAGGQVSPVQSPSSRTHCFGPFLKGPPGCFPACPARARAHARAHPSRGRGCRSPGPAPNGSQRPLWWPGRRRACGPLAGGRAVRGGLVLGGRPRLEVKGARSLALRCGSCLWFPHSDRARLKCGGSMPAASR